MKKIMPTIFTYTLSLFAFLFFTFSTYAQTRTLSKSKKTISSSKINSSNIEKTVDVNTLANWVLRASYKESVGDLKNQIEKVKEQNKKKNEIRDQLKKFRDTVSEQRAIQDYILELRMFRAELILASAEQFETAKSTKRKPTTTSREAVVAGLIRNMAYTYTPLPSNTRVIIPNRIPRATINSLKSLDAEIAFWDMKINNNGTDRQLMHIDLQSVLQKQQQITQMMSNIAKMIHETEMAIIRKMR